MAQNIFSFRNLESFNIYLYRYVFFCQKGSSFSTLIWLSQFPSTLKYKDNKIKSNMAQPYGASFVIIIIKLLLSQHLPTIKVMRINYINDHRTEHFDSDFSIEKDENFNSKVISTIFYLYYFTFIFIFILEI